jgi:hypothetical protein
MKKWDQEDGGIGGPCLLYPSSTIILQPFIDKTDFVGVLGFR